MTLTLQWFLCFSSTSQTYEKTPALGPYRADSIYMKECAQALNVLYVHDRSYEPYLVHWLFPLQICYEDDMGASESRDGR